MLSEQTTLFRVSDYETESRLGLADWELDNECTDSLTDSSNYKHVVSESRCTNEEVGEERTNGTINSYFPAGKARGFNQYYRYSWREGNRVHHQHISGGNVDSLTARSRMLLVKNEIKAGRSPVEIVQFIKSFKISDNKTVDI